MATTPARQRLRDLLDKRELIIAPGVFDGISAQLTKRTGHVAAYMTGAGVAASGFGLPDIGLVTATEMADRVRMIADALGDIPLIADADTGYGAPMNVVRTVRSYDAAGVAAIQLEDQVFPEAVRPSAGQTGGRRRGIRTDAGGRTGRQVRRQPAGGGAHRRARPARTGRGHRTGQPIRASRRGRHLRRGAAGRQRNRAYRSRGRRSAADQSGARRHDSAGIGGTAAGVGLRDRDPSEQPADARDIRHAAKPLRAQRHRHHRPPADQPRRLLQSGRHGASGWTSTPATRARTHHGHDHHRKDLRAQGRSGRRCRRATPWWSTSI